MCARALCVTIFLCIFLFVVDGIGSHRLVPLLARVALEFHKDCITPWLAERQRVCPLCKRDPLAKNGTYETFSRTESSDSSTTSEQVSMTDRDQPDDQTQGQEVVTLEEPTEMSFATTPASDQD